MTNKIEMAAESDNQAIQAAREQINQLDQGIVDLLKQRFQTSALIGQIKGKTHLQVLDSDREKRVLDQVAQLESDPGTRKYLQKIFQEILKNSRDYQHELMQNEETK
ncbi:chorismate mutase [Lentilactobacillus parakefiri]|uniref:Chorismate mutase n=1 Tax=Lentilactobacillus parakefiri TaxID=152332 RepID=A0A269YC01_9LACO|nr:chorismate mutase [Lentilactobacillus parakefiri]PAK82999.1 chorismate mutase [Lentilactobacillus parakefiri]